MAIPEKVVIAILNYIGKMKSSKTGYQNLALCNIV